MTIRSIVAAPFDFVDFWNCCIFFIFRSLIMKLIHNINRVYNHNFYTGHFGLFFF